jgi:hypothetical protein
VPNSGVDITPGAGAAIAVNSVDGLDLQVVKADWGADGASIPASSDGTHGLDVHVKLVDGAVVVNNPTAANLQVEIPGAVGVVNSGGPLQVGNAAGAFIVQVSGSITLPVDGTVTADQGTAAAVASAWPMILSDGTHTVPLDTTNGNALKVSVVATPGAGAVEDEAAFTGGTTNFDIVGGVYNDALGTPSSGQAAAFRMTQNRGQHVNLRTSAGAEIGLSTAPVRIDPTGTTTQPVSGTVAVTLNTSTNAGATSVEGNYNTAGTQEVVMFGIALPANGGAVEGGTQTNPVVVSIGQSGSAVSATNPVPAQLSVAGAAATATNPVPVQPSIGGGAVTSVSAGAGNPLPVLPQPSPSGFWKYAVSFTASQTAQALHTPASGKTSYIEGFIITQVTSGQVQIYDNTNASGNLLYQGTPPVGGIACNNPARPIPLSAVNNVLRYTTGSGATGDITIWGYDA